MRTKALKPRVMVRIKEVNLYRFIILFFIIFLFITKYCCVDKTTKYDKHTVQIIDDDLPGVLCLPHDNLVASQKNNLQKESKCANIA